MTRGDDLPRANAGLSVLDTENRQDLSTIARPNATAPGLELSINRAWPGLCVVELAGELDALTCTLLMDCVREQLAAAPVPHREPRPPDNHEQPSTPGRAPIGSRYVWYYGGQGTRLGERAAGGSVIPPSNGIVTRPNSGGYAIAVPGGASTRGGFGTSVHGVTTTTGG